MTTVFKVIPEKKNGENLKMLIYIVYLTKIREIDVLFLMNIQKYTKFKS